MTAKNCRIGIAKMPQGRRTSLSLWGISRVGAVQDAQASRVPPPAAVPGMPQVLGQVLDTNRRPCSFPASALHATMPWQGHRWLVTAYTCQHLPCLSASASAVLRGWGFPLPPSVSSPVAPIPSSAESRAVSNATASGSRIFVDVCCGATRPLCAAFEALHLPVLPVDILQDEPLDVLSDDVFDCLIRLCFSGQVGLMRASPPCKEYSRLKLRPGGPKAIRSPEFLGGLPTNTAEMQSRVTASRTLLQRCVQLLECSFEGGGHGDLEQPTNAMSWLEDFVQAFLLRVHAHCVSTPACRWLHPLLRFLLAWPVHASTLAARMPPLQVSWTSLAGSRHSKLQCILYT